MRPGAGPTGRCASASASTSSPVTPSAEAWAEAARLLRGIDPEAVAAARADFAATRSEGQRRMAELSRPGRGRIRAGGPARPRGPPQRLGRGRPGPRRCGHRAGGQPRRGGGPHRGVPGPGLRRVHPVGVPAPGGGLALSARASCPSSVRREAAALARPVPTPSRCSRSDEHDGTGRGPGRAHHRRAPALRPPRRRRRRRLPATTPSSIPPCTGRSASTCASTT